LKPEKGESRIRPAGTIIGEEEEEEEEEEAVQA